MIPADPELDSQQPAKAKKRHNRSAYQHGDFMNSQAGDAKDNAGDKHQHGNNDRLL